LIPKCDGAIPLRNHQASSLYHEQLGTTLLVQSMSPMEEVVSKFENDSTNTRIFS
jgi:hypothetical protein